MNYDKSNYKDFKLKIDKKDTNSEGGVKFGKKSTPKHKALKSHAWTPKNKEDKSGELKAYRYK